MKIIFKILYLIRDFILYLIGKNYFHLPEKKGKYRNSFAFYYVEMKGKYYWRGKISENQVPILWFPELGIYIEFPSMVIQWGLGAVEVYSEDNDLISKDCILRCYEWIKKNLDEKGALNNHFIQIDSAAGYTSNMSDMTQSLAISFVCRAHFLGFIDEQEAKIVCKNLANPIIARILRESNFEVTKKKNIYLYEYYMKEKYLVLNGWIFTIFGLIDLKKLNYDQVTDSILINTISTLIDFLPKFLNLKEKQRILTHPTYHDLHIIQLDILYEITKKNEFLKYANLFRESNNFYNRFKYTTMKIIEKLYDQYPYSTEK